MNRVEAEPIPPQPRKPTGEFYPSCLNRRFDLLINLLLKLIENPVKHLAVGRIAAKFSAPKEYVEVSTEPSSVSSRNTSGAGSTSAIGRGRGLLGKLLRLSS